MVVSPRTQVADEGVTAAEPYVFRLEPESLRILGEDVAHCWNKLLLTRHGHTGQDLEALVRKTMAEHPRCCPRRSSSV
ncbi:MAG: hypothetical protein WKF73_12345 [Nocardioidaceae bacterium]